MAHRTNLYFYLILILFITLILMGYRANILDLYNTVLKEIKETEEEYKINEAKELTYLDYEFWSNKSKISKEVIMSIEEIELFNDENFLLNKELIYIEKISNTILKEDLIDLINSISIIPKQNRYDDYGNLITMDYYDNLYSNINIDKIEKLNYTRYGITTNRTVLRTFPTYDRAHNSKDELRFDRFMETAIYPLEPVAIYWDSLDSEWLFGSIYNYTGWIPKKDIVIGEKDEIFDYVNHSEFLVVISPKIVIDDINFDMGVKIPIKEETEAGYTLLLPVIGEQFKLRTYSIPKNDNLNRGYLPYTKENLIRQGLKFYGEEYGWGGSNNTRDCSGFILDIHRTFGFKLPRNSKEQGLNSLGNTYEFKEENLEERLKILDEMEMGTALYMPGHTMLYLGKDNGEHYMIHQYVGHYELKGEKLEYKEVMKTDITPVTIKTSTGITYLERVYIGKEFRRKRSL